MTFVSEKLYLLIIRLWQNRNSAIGNNCVSRAGPLIPLLSTQFEHIHSLQICLKHLHEMKPETFTECAENKHTQMNFYFL